MIDYSKCTKEQLINLLEHYATKIYRLTDLYAPGFTTITNKGIYHMLKGDGLPVEWVENGINRTTDNDFVKSYVELMELWKSMKDEPCICQDLLDKMKEDLKNI